MKRNQMPEVAVKNARNRTSFWMVAFLVASGCDTQRHLVGEGTDGGTTTGTGGSGGGSATGTGAGGAASAPGSVSGSGGKVAASSGGHLGTGGVMVTGSGGTAGVAATATALPIPAREAVTRASQLLWQIAPDQALLTAADSLKTTADLRQQVLRMLIDARASNGVRAFFRWWLLLDGVANTVRDRVRFPQFDNDLISAMAAEPETFGSYVTLDGDGLYATLMTAPFTFVNEKLAGVYGFTGISGTTLRRVAIDPATRSGLLTQPGLLTLSTPTELTAPSHRGAYLSERILCREVPLPPPSTSSENPPTSEPSTARDRLQKALTDPACAACHALIDPLGFPFERYDAIGQFRTTENGLPIDPSGEYATGSSILKYSDAIGLAGLLAKEPVAQSCFSQRWLEFAVGRLLTEAEASAKTEVHGRFAASGFNMRELIAAVLSTNVFLTHTAVCTPGADQTCNADPKLSSLRGKCTSVGRCVCTDTAIDPTTGRCL